MIQKLRLSPREAQLFKESVSSQRKKSTPSTTALHELEFLLDEEAHFNVIAECIYQTFIIGGVDQKNPIAIFQPGDERTSDWFGITCTNLGKGPVRIGDMRTCLEKGGIQIRFPKPDVFEF